MHYPTFEQPIGDCRAADMDEEVLARLLTENDDIRFHNIICIRHGERVLDIAAAPFRNNVPQELYSMSKSFVSAAVGIAIYRGMLRLDDAVIDLLDRCEFADRPFLKQLTVRHLLTMTVGQEPADFQRIWTEDDWTEAFLDTTIAHPPGDIFEYNNFATYMISSIIQHQSGKRLLDFLNEHLFTHIGVTAVAWDDLGKGIDWGASGLYLTADDIARFGFLLLDRGNWNGHRLIDSAYLDLATAKQVESQPPTPAWTECAQGYGFHFWLNSFGGFRASGMLMQELVVLPEHDLVLVVLGCNNDGSRDVLGVIARDVIEACERGYRGAKGVAPRAVEHFTRRLDWQPKQRYPECCDGRIYRLEEPVRRGRVFNIETELSAIGLAEKNGEVVITFVDQGETHRLICGTDGRFAVNDYRYRVGSETLNIRAALIGEWLDERTFFFEFRPLSINMWAIYWLTFTSTDEIELRTFIDARIYDPASDNLDEALTICGRVVEQNEPCQR